MILIDKEEIIVGECNTGKILFSNILEYSNCEPLANNIGETLKLETSKIAKILVFRQKLSKRMQIYLLTFFLQLLMIL